MSDVPGAEVGAEDLGLCHGLSDPLGGVGSIPTRTLPNCRGPESVVLMHDEVVLPLFPQPGVRNVPVLIVAEAGHARVQVVLPSEDPELPMVALLQLVREVPELGLDDVDESAAEVEVGGEDLRTSAVAEWTELLRALMIIGAQFTGLAYERVMEVRQVTEDDAEVLKVAPKRIGPQVIDELHSLRHQAPVVAPAKDEELLELLTALDEAIGADFPLDKVNLVLPLFSAVLGLLGSAGLGLLGSAGLGLLFVL